MKTKTQEELRERWNELRAEKPKLRIRDAARDLGVSEAELLATRTENGVTRLEGDWPALIQFLPKLGRVMCLTRNESAVHERYGEFREIDFFHGMGQVVGPDIDLRLFLKHWIFGFAVTDETPEGDRQSLQFFDAHGDAVHKIYLQRESDYGSYGVLLDKFRMRQASSEVAVVPVPPKSQPLPDAEIDREGFRAGWLALKDTHGFYPLLQNFRVTREQALRLAPEGFARSVPVDSVRLMLEGAAASELPIMVFIGSRGCIQIHTGLIQNVKVFGSEWLNVLDDEFNMHLRLPLLASAWIVKKPTTEGIVTSLEVFDVEGENSVLFFGRRKPGEEESSGWRELAGRMEDGQ